MTIGMNEKRAAWLCREQSDAPSQLMRFKLF
jgi:hypothetical protein